MGKDKDSSKNNSKKYKSQVKKDIQKKIKDKADRKRKAYGNVSGGSRVVKHDKSSVNAATPYYTNAPRVPETASKRIRRGGYGNYAHHYPYQEGVIDKEMAAANYYDKALRQHKNANQFHSLVSGLAAGKFDDLDENRRVAVAKQVVEDERQKKVKEIEIMEKKAKDTNTVTKAKMKALGMAENASDMEITSRHERARAKLEKKEKIHAKINDLNLTLDKVRDVALETEGAAENLRKNFGDHPRIRHIVADLDKVSPEMVDDVYTDVQKELKVIEPQLKKYYAINARLMDLTRANQELNKMEEEFAAVGRNNPELAGILAKKQAVYGDPMQRLSDIEKAIGDKEQAYEDFYTGQLPRLQSKFKRFREASEEYIQTRKDMREKAIEILLDSEAVSPDEREQLTHAPHTIADVELARMMEQKAPIFERGKADIQQNYHYYAGMLKRFENPELARIWNLDNRYLKHIQKFSDLYDNITQSIHQGTPMDQGQIDDEILGITRKLLRNPHLNDNVEYGPRLETAMSAIAERPEDPYSYARENRPVDLIMSDTNVPVERASHEQNQLAIGDSHGASVVETPYLAISDATRLENVDPAQGFYELSSPGFEDGVTYSYQHRELDPWEKEEELRKFNIKLQENGHDPIDMGKFEGVLFRHFKRRAAAQRPARAASRPVAARILKGEIF